MKPGAGIFRKINKIVKPFAKNSQGENGREH